RSSGSRGRRPTAQQHAAVSDLLLQHRASGRLSAADLVSSMTNALTLRPVRPEDRELLLRIYASTRAEELPPVPWTQEQKDAFLRQQFEAQSAYWGEHYKDAERSIIEVDGAVAGRFYVQRWDDEIRLVDIALLPEYRGRGIGTALLKRLSA